MNVSTQTMRLSQLLRLAWPETCGKPFVANPADDPAVYQRCVRCGLTEVVHDGRKAADVVERMGL
jgi:hypothetical protein